MAHSCESLIKNQKNPYKFDWCTKKLREQERRVTQTHTWGHQRDFWPSSSQPRMSQLLA